MILDNADDADVFFSQKEGNDVLASFLPKTGPGKILVTSRSSDVAERLTGSHKSVIQLPQMDEPQALQLFRNKLDAEPEVNDAKTLINAMDLIPLAITQAAAYINRRAPRVSVASYYNDFRKSQKRRNSLLHNDAGDLRRYEGVSNSVVVTWQVTFEKIRAERPSAAKLLSLMSFFHAQNIPEYLLYGYNGASQDDQDSSEVDAEFEDDVDMLRGYSLIMLGLEDGYCEMHPLVQFCTQVWFSKFGDLPKWKSQFLGVMSEHFPKGSYDTWPECRVMLPHVEPLLDDEPSDKSDLVAWIKLLENVAHYFFKIPQYSKSETLVHRFTEARVKLLGEAHQKIPEDMIEKAKLAIAQMRTKEAESILNQVIETYEKVLGEDNLDVLKALTNLSTVYWLQRRLPEAEKLQLRILRIRKRVQGDEHDDTLKIMTDLAKTIGDQGRLKEAERMHWAMMTIRWRVYGPSHQMTLWGLAILVMMWYEQGRYEDAEAMQRWLVGARKQIDGEEHPMTLIAVMFLADIYIQLGRLKEAEALGLQALECQRRVHGDDHQYTLITRNHLARTWFAQGRRDEAIAVIKDCIRREKEVLGEAHPLTLGSLTSLDVFQNLQATTEAGKVVGKQAD